LQAILEKRGLEKKSLRRRKKETRKFRQGKKKKKSTSEEEERANEPPYERSKLGRKGALVAYSKKGCKKKGEDKQCVA